MNFIISSSDVREEEIWRESVSSVFPPFFLKEVDINGDDRIDIIFGDVVKGIQSSKSGDAETRDRIFQIKELLRGGCTLALLQISKDVLYEESDKIRKELLRIFSKDDYWFEIRSCCLQAFGVNTTAFRHFIIIYKKNLTHQVIFTSPQGLTFKVNQERDTNNNVNINKSLLVFLLNHVKEKILC